VIGRATRVLTVCAYFLPLAVCPSAVMAGGAWVPERGSGYFQLGYSVKTADTSWGASGQTRHHTSWHIFRYGYVGGQVGLGRGFAVNAMVLYLDGLEGARGDMEHNAGLSEAFLGLTYQFREGTWPMAVAYRHRSSYLYDLPGQYHRHLHDSQGDVRGESPEWRGLLGSDHGLYFLASRSLLDHQGWMSAEIGYNFRTTNLSDEIPMYFEIGLPLPWQQLNLKATYRWVQSVGNHRTPERRPSDRFGCSALNCFPNASMMAVGVSLMRDFGREQRWWAEAGFNQWVWGRSARKYEEPFLAVGRRFLPTTAGRRVRERMGYPS
jgi:protein XagA